MGNKSLISCLCISNNRATQLKKAIAYFQAQTYTNKELIIVSGKYDAAYEKIIESCSDNSIKYHYQGNDTLTLGELRNVALEKSNGKYFCIWDDDDWYHYQRLEIQIKELIKSRKKSVVLPFVLMLDTLTKRAYLSLPVWPPATLLCNRSVITPALLYPPRNRSEDSFFLNNLFHHKYVYPLINPILYIYIRHNTNTCTPEHFSKISGDRLSEELTQLIIDITEDKFSCKEASKLLCTSKILEELDYFAGLKLSDSSRKE